MPEQEEKAPREGANLSKGRPSIREAFEETTFPPSRALGEVGKAVGQGLGKVFNPIPTEQQAEELAAAARGTEDYRQQFELWMNRFMREYSPEEYGRIEDFMDAKERVMKEFPFSEGQSRADLTDELAYNEAGEAYLQREAQAKRRAGPPAASVPSIGASLRGALRAGTPSGGQ